MDGYGWFWTHFSTKLKKNQVTLMRINIRTNVENPYTDGNRDDYLKESLIQVKATTMRFTAKRLVR